MKEVIYDGMRKGTKQILDKDGKVTAELPSIENLKVVKSGPDGEEPQKLKFEDVWGTPGKDRGMIVTRTDEKCPHFGDIVPYKSVTVVCKKEQVDDVVYFLEYNHGHESVSAIKDIEGDLGLVAIRSDYQCW